MAVFIVVLVGVVYTFTKTSYAVFSDDVDGEKTIEVSVSNETSCTDNSNPPVLSSEMIPVYYDEIDKTWKIADKENKNDSWYDYCNKKWANSVVIKNNGQKYSKTSIGTEINIEDISAMFVWIPKYKYQVWNYNEKGNVSSKEKEILLAFEKDSETTGDIKCDRESLMEVCSFAQRTCANGSCDNKTYTHPAFTTGYTGFWVGKFELSKEQNSLSIVPNKESYRNLNIKEFNEEIKSNSIEGLSKNENISMINNDQWGAIAYLAYSKYGKTSEIANNNCESYITGIGATNINDGININVCNNQENIYNGKYGMQSSTTGNTYGVYDMSGGSYEYVLGVASNDNEIIPGASGYTKFEKIDKNNLYQKAESSKNTSISKLGDGIREVTNGATAWYNDSNYVVSEKWPWFIRGGSNKDKESAGIFNSSYSSGSKSEEYSTRVVILK